MDDRALLSRLMEGPATGEALARACGQTRAAVWKRIDALREAGLAIEARPGHGYALVNPLELLDSERIAAALPPEARARTAAVEIAWNLDSTNSELLRRVPAIDGTATVLLAERQTRGRGRRGRDWASPMAAHLYLSLSRTFAGGLSRLGGLSLVAGIATVEALHAAGYPGVRLKWPNDLAALVVARWLVALDEFDASGLAPFLPRYAAADALAGHAVTVRGDREQLSGTASGLAADGALRVRLADGSERCFHSGEVSVRRGDAA